MCLRLTENQFTRPWRSDSKSMISRCQGSQPEPSARFPARNPLHFPNAQLLSLPIPPTDIPPIIKITHLGLFCQHRQIGNLPRNWRNGGDLKRIWRWWENQDHRAEREGSSRAERRRVSRPFARLVIDIGLIRPSYYSVIPFRPLVRPCLSVQNRSSPLRV
jgi:hypothetical protein